MVGSENDPFRTLLDEAAIGIKWIASDGRLVEVNQRFCQLLGYDRQELLVRRYDQITHPDDIARDQALFARLLAGEIGSYTLDKRYLSKSGEVFHVRVTSALTRAQDALRVSIVQDLRDTETVRREGELRLKSILDTAPDAMIVIDERGTVESFSPSAEQLFGYAASEVVGRNVKMLMPSPNREAHDSYIDRYVKTGERRIIGIGRVVSGLRKDGTTFPMDLSVGETSVSGKRIFTGFIRDLTERAEADRKIAQMHQELTHVARLSEMGQMGSTLAHEINQPLTAITNYLRAGRRMLEAQRTPGVERILETMDKATAQAQRAGEIIRHLRQFTEKRETERHDEDINEVVREAITLGLLGARSSGVNVRTKFSPDKPVALVDKIQVQQVVVNLVRNALDAMVNAEQKELTLATRLRDGMVVIAVTDTGSGLSKEVADRLFKPFVTTKEKGMGVGLSICRQIVEAHGGSIAIETPERGGASFVFTFPAAAGG